jgi:flagellar biosynthesis/type III secretory pathway protein FliH
VRLHPADYEILAAIRPELIRAGDQGGRKVEVLASDEIGRGGCRIETEIGIVDASLPTQFQEIKRQLLDE